MQFRVAVLLGVMVMLYPDVRAAGLVPVEEIRDWAAAEFGQEKARSVMTRFINEEALLERANERPLFGWGRHCRACNYDPRSGDVDSIRDGDWIITWGNYGRVGFLGKYLLLLLPVFFSARQVKRVRRESDRRLLSALAVIIAFSVVDLLPNGNFNYLLTVLSGALLGCCRGVLLHDAQRARLKRERTAARWAQKDLHDHQAPEPATVAGRRWARLT